MFLVDVNASACHEVCDQVEVRADVEEALELLPMIILSGGVTSHHIT